MISRTGNDALRDALLEEMDLRGMATDGMQFDADHPTGQVQVILENGGHRFDILPGQAYDHICPETTDRTLAGIQPRPKEEG